MKIWKWERTLIMTLWLFSFSIFRYIFYFKEILGLSICLWAWKRGMHFSDILRVFQLKLNWESFIEQNRCIHLNNFPLVLFIISLWLPKVPVSWHTFFYAIRSKKLKTELLKGLGILAFLKLHFQFLNALILAFLH